MLAFIESIIKLLINLLFADQLAQENQRLRKENQQLKREKEELARAKAGVIENHFSLFQKYITLNKQKEELARKLERYQSPCLRDSAVLGSPQVERLSRADINQQFSPEDIKVIDQIFQEYNPSEELTI